MIPKKIRRLFQVGRNFPGNLLQAPVIVLCYHRVARLEHDPHQLAVSPENFQEQMKFLRDNFPVLRFDGEWFFKECSFVITFDDGYADNLHEALPVLHEMGLPATIFVSSGFVGGARAFPWDGNDVPARPEHRQLSADELRQLAGDPLVTLGSHTLTHPRLSELAPAEQEREILAGHRTLEEVVGKKLAVMSYPFGNHGDFDRNCREICRQAGFMRAAANYPGQAHSWTDPMAVPRHVIRDYGAREFRERLFRFRFL
ncbi:MAG: polysaccharide deacetylase family protein [Lentisphaeria bacterium]|nr:polysaccharide deacetylase family protein [Lentisphaeria bacterium]